MTSRRTVPVAFAVFDSGLDALKLPILRPVSPAEGERPSTGRREPVAFFVEKYFEWSARVEGTHYHSHMCVDHIYKTPPQRSRTQR